MARDSLSIEQILTMLTESPSRIAALTADLTPIQLRTAPKSDEWSANDILAHLRSCADVWGKCMATILSQDRPTFRALSPRTWIKKTNYLEQEFQPSLRVFTTQRTELLALLKPLAPESWSRAAVVTGAGKPLELTVLSYAHRMAIHERPHVTQIKDIVDTLWHMEIE